MQNKEKLNVVELFSGIGSFSQALKKQNIRYEILFTSDIDKNANKVFEKLHGKVNNLEDIIDIKEKKILKFRDQCDILSFGSPCQDFSQAGFNKGGIKNSQTRSSLLWEGVRIITIIQPKIIIFENVKNLKVRHKNVFLDFKRKLRKNYFYRSMIINSLHYNIPQNRSRIFLVGLHKKVFDKAFSFKPRKTPYKNSLNLSQFLNIDSFSKREILKIKPKYNYTNFWSWKDNKGNKNGSYNRAWKINRYCGTISYSNKIKITDGEKVSFLTPEESWKLMGWEKKEFNKIIDVVSKNKLISLAGNAVVISVLEEIIKKLPLHKLWNKIDLRLNSQKKQEDKRIKKQENLLILPDSRINISKTVEKTDSVFSFKTKRR